MPVPAYGLARLALQVGLANLRHRPRQRTPEQRLSTLPLQGLPVTAPVEIFWNEHLAPYVEAQTDRDLAVALGLVHAHLRLAQMELLRLVAQGRLSEMLGPVAVGVDHALRLLDPIKAASAILCDLTEETRDWLDGFVAGVNHHLASPVDPPIEFRLLGISTEPWTIENVLQIARLLAADVHWIVWRRLLRLSRSSDWPQIWGRMVTEGVISADPEDDDGAVAHLMHGLVRSGSNALALAGSGIAKGAWLAGDPHLPLAVPCIWLAAACRSPSYNAAGLMMPGVPVMAIGRNPWIAWGGTNLHAASSELFDVSELPPSAFHERRVKLKVRWSRDRELVLRETDYGPVLSDAALFGGDRPLALRWVGHKPSDEISALLALNRAHDWDSFRRAAKGFAVPGQTLIYADREGHIGRLLATWLPCRPLAVPPDFVSPPVAATAWDRYVTAEDLPAELDPSCGFVVSANDRPPPTRVPVGWLFSPADRARRLTEICRRGSRIGLDDLKRLLQDVYSEKALKLRDRLLAALPADCRASALYSALASWDGRYNPESVGALAYELVLNRLATAVPAGQRAAFGTIWAGRALLAAGVAGLAPGELTDRLRIALGVVESAVRGWGSWGRVHRLCLAHPLAMIPGLGRRFRFTDWPWPGSGDTVMKSGHGLVDGPHRATYGSNARYIFDLSDPDGNYMVVLGGQDGVPGSTAFLDQAKLFRNGGMIQLPLRPEIARTSFRHVTRIDPPSPRNGSDGGR